MHLTATALLNYQFAGTFPVQPRPTVRRAYDPHLPARRAPVARSLKSRFDGGLCIGADDIGPNVSISIRMPQ